MIRPTFGLAVVGALALTGCYDSRPEDTPRNTVPAARITGAAVSCIPLSRIDTTRVRDDRTIDFLSSSRKGWRNTLPYGCPGLRSNDGFSYETSLSQLCSSDVIHVIEQADGPHRGAACGLGQFVPIELAR